MGHRDSLSYLIVSWLEVQAETTILLRFGWSVMLEYSSFEHFPKHSCYLLARWEKRGLCIHCPVQPCRPTVSSREESLCIIVPVQFKSVLKLLMVVTVLIGGKQQHHSVNDGVYLILMSVMLTGCLWTFVPKSSDVCLLYCELQYVTVRMECGRKHVRILKTCCESNQPYWCIFKMLNDCNISFVQTFFFFSSKLFCLNKLTVLSLNNGKLAFSIAY